MNRISRREKAFSSRLHWVSGNTGILLCLLVILASNAVLSYSALSFQPKAWWFLGGILFPSFLLSRINLRPEGSIPIPVLPTWIWISLLVVGMAARLFKLSGFHPWPAGDEALQAYFALELVKEWNWQFFYTSGQHPPLLIWILTPLLKFWPPLPLVLWVPSAFFSCAALGLAYFTARQYVGRNEAFLFFLLMAFSYWPMVAGRWCVQGALVPFFELACFCLLGLLWKARAGKPEAWKAGAAGLCLGLGAWTFTSWLVVVGTLVPLGAFLLFQRGSKGRPPLIWFLAGWLAGFFPWAWAAFREGFGGYMKGMSMASGFFDWGQQIIVALSYLTSLFWGPLQEGSGYGATWGGILNPLLTTCLILGILELFRRRHSGWVHCGAGLCALFLLPGLLTADHVEMYRIIQVMPLMLLGTAFGLKSLLGLLPSGRRLPFLAALMVLSFCTDLFHLCKPHLEKGPSWRWSDSAQDPSHEAYLAFREAAEKWGPGLVFTEFLPLARNHTLRVGAYSFNAVDHPGFDSRLARWAGVFVNLHYQPFLEARFPGSQWRHWDQGPQEDGGMVVGILPVNARTRRDLDRWILAHQHFHRLGVQAENMFNNQELYRRAVRGLPEGYPLVEGDRFLESIYGEWCAQYHYGNGLKGNIAALERAIQRGYPAANLYYKLGAFYRADGNREASRAALEKAARRPFDRTAASKLLAGTSP